MYQAAAAGGSEQTAVESKQGSLHGKVRDKVQKMASNAKCASFVAMVLCRARQAAGEQSQASRVALLLSARSRVSPATFLTSQKMARNAKCAFFVAMALGHARQAAHIGM